MQVKQGSDEERLIFYYQNTMDALKETVMSAAQAAYTVSTSRKGKNQP